LEGNYFTTIRVTQRSDDRRCQTCDGPIHDAVRPDESTPKLPVRAYVPATTRGAAQYGSQGDEAPVSKSPFCKYVREEVVVVVKVVVVEVVAVVVGGGVVVAGVVVVVATEMEAAAATGH
jgi:hypothetical protein